MTKILKNEDGIALVLVMFMVLVLSTLVTSLMFVSQTEVWSSQNYTLTSQVRYAAESGTHAAANHLMFTYAPPSATNVADPLASYLTNVSPVTDLAGNAIVLGPTAALSNYPVAAVRDAFILATTGPLTMDNGTASYTATATLMSMHSIVNAFSNLPVTLMTWEIVGNGAIGVARRAQTQVSVILERPKAPAFNYAAFATSSGCAALSFNGGATTDSYDSKNQGVGPTPAVTDGGGNVGTNGNLDEAGNTTQINGSLSTPRAGVGNCTANNVTAATVSGGAAITDGLTELSQNVVFPTPEVPNPLPPTNTDNFKKTLGCPAGFGAPTCVASVDGATLKPALGTGTLTLGNVSTEANAILHLGAGTYIVNSLTMAGNSSIVIDTGPVIFRIAGVGTATPLDITGNGISNTTYDPLNLQFVYAGTGNMKIAGGAQTAALLYAPNATGAITGGADWYGSVILKQLTETGGASIHYDTQLQNSAFVAGNYGLSTFTWKKF